MKVKADATIAQVGTPNRNSAPADMLPMAFANTASAPIDPGGRDRQAHAVDQQRRQQSGERHVLEGVEPNAEASSIGPGAPSTARMFGSRARPGCCAGGGSSIRMKRDDQHPEQRDRAVDQPQRLPAERQQVRAGQHHDDRAERQVRAEQRQHGVEILGRCDGAQQARDRQRRGEEAAALDHARRDQDAPAFGEGAGEAAEPRGGKAGQQRLRALNSEATMPAGSPPNAPSMP